MQSPKVVKIEAKKDLLLTMMDNLLIYSQKKTSRARYVFRLVFHDILKIPYHITTNIDEFQSSDLPKFIYGEKAFSDDIFIRSHGLLFERGVENLSLEPFEYKGSKAFFPVYDKASYFSFDPFSAIFYLVSRYEEYQPFVRDEHGRFTAHLSKSYELGILDKPLVDIWAMEIKKMLQEKYKGISFTERKYRFIPTYDIDSAYAYSNKGLVRTIGRYLMDMKDLNWFDISERTKVLFGGKEDPFDTFDLQINYQKKYNLHPIYFILFARYGRFDKNINIRNKHFRFLIKQLADYATLGIHPSYFSTENPEYLAYEISKLSEVLNQDVSRSRQHFLRLILPDTYRNLLDYDITADFSMGYAALPGFRAGTCSTYNFYDLDMEEETKLRIHPFAVMDGTLKDYMQLTPADAIGQIRYLIDEVKKVKGTFISLWHNESLSEQKRWKGWRRVYEELLEMAAGD
jgi:hypothetical protein